MEMNVNFFLSISVILFVIGTAGVLLRRSIIVILMSIELMLNAVNLAFAAFAARLQSMDGQVFIFFVMTVAAAEAAVGLAIVIALFRLRGDTDADGVSRMRW
jgi:NADH-quinone oxidoreductase subunit K